MALTLVNLNGADDDVPSIRLGPMVAAGAQPGTLQLALPPAAPPVPGPYLGLVEVDGVSSVPTVAGGRFARPRVTL